MICYLTLSLTLIVWCYFTKLTQDVIDSKIVTVKYEINSVCFLKIKLQCYFIFLHFIYLQYSEFLIKASHNKASKY